MEHKINDIFDRFPTVQNIIIMMETKVIKYHNAIRIHLTLNFHSMEYIIRYAFYYNKTFHSQFKFSNQINNFPFWVKFA